MNELLKKIQFDDVKAFETAAKKERVSFENPAAAEWYGIFDNEKIVSFCCLVIKGKSARFKSNYTLPNYRGRGYLQRFIDFAISECMRRGVYEMTAFCTPMSVKSHLRNGAIPKSKKNDITFVRYIFRRKK